MKQVCDKCLGGIGGPSERERTKIVGGLSGGPSERERENEK